MNAVERLQINVEVFPLVLLNPNVRSVMMPVLWIEQVNRLTVLAVLNLILFLFFSF